MFNIKSIAAVAACFVLLSACKKDEGAEPTPVPIASPNIADYSLLQDGNYWVYERQALDSLGNYTGAASLIDTATVDGDSLINGVVWKVIRGTGGAVPPIALRRDSADYLVDLYIGAVFKATTSDEVIRHEEYPTLVSIDYTVFVAPQQINVPLGTFTCQEVRGVIGSLGFPVPPDYRLSRRYWSVGQGMVFGRVFYLANGSGYEDRLIASYIQ